MIGRRFVLQSKDIKNKGFKDCFQQIQGLRRDGILVIIYRIDNPDSFKQVCNDYWAVEIIVQCFIASFFNFLYFGLFLPVFN